jgi:hypothetical protein
VKNDLNQPVVDNGVRGSCGVKTDRLTLRSPGVGGSRGVCQTCKESRFGHVMYRPVTAMQRQRQKQPISRWTGA